MTPAYLQQAYDLSYLSATQGTGDTVAVVSVNNDPNAASDLAIFRSTYGLPACATANGCFTQLNESGQASPLPATDWSWAQEDVAGPRCRFGALPKLPHHACRSECSRSRLTCRLRSPLRFRSGAKQVSISAGGEYSGNPFGDFSAPGVSILAAAGDDGAAPVGYADVSRRAPLRHRSGRYVAEP